jgi:ABC-2 type transport system ATP-binding protein
LPAACADRRAAPPAAPAGPAAIEIVGLRKSYGQTVALADLTLTVQPGEVFGFLGPNGAGKTTAIKILTGLTRPSGGQARVFGLPAASVAARRRIGYLPEQFRFHDWLSGRGLLDFHGRLAGLSASERARRILDLLERVGLADRGDDLLRGYSKGMTQRIGLAQALLHQPDLVLLDEPTSALDPLGRRQVRDLIRELRAAGTTVFLNSHLLSEIELVCDRVAIVDHGRVIASGRLTDLVGGLAELRLEVAPIDERLFGLLARFGPARRLDDGRLTLSVERLDLAPEVAAALVLAGYRLQALIPVQRSLEEVFLGVVEGKVT